MKTTLLALFFALTSAAATAQTFPLTIVTVDASNDTPLGFVNVQLEGSSLAGTTDAEGRLRLPAVPAGDVVILTSFLGYENQRTELTLEKSARVVVGLTPSAAILETIEVSSNDASDRLERPLMGVERLSIADIEVLPVVLGEVDVFRGLQLLSGVNSAGEASNGLSIRGGTIDQNLVLLDGAPIFTPTHLFGLFSVFTPDAVGAVDLYRANIPARFGGRVSSVLDVRSRNPTADKFRMQGGIGLVSSSLSVETPLTKNKKLKVLAAARAGLNDFVFNFVDRLKDTRSRFVDGTLKLRYTANDKNIFTFSGFYSQDFYQINLENRFNGIVADQNKNDYFTLNGTLDWLRVFTDRTSLLLRVVSSNHEPSVIFPQAESDLEVAFRSQILYRSAQATLDHRVGAHQFSGGVQLIRYDLEPGRLDPGGVTSVNPVALANEQAYELAAYLEDEWKIGEWLTASAGLRYVRFNQIGPGEQRDYGGNPIRDERTLEATIPFGSGETMQSYGGLEPRLGLSYAVNDKTSVKAAYALTRQYIQNIFNATTPLPSSRWAVADNNILPQEATLFSAGIYRLLKDGAYEFSLEAYHRSIDNLVEYRPGAEFFLNPAVETDVIQGKGEAYGVEVSLTKKTGKLTGQVNYAYARSRNRVAGPTFNTSVNGGEWYNGYFDQPHALNTNLALDDGKTNRISLNFVLQSNRPYTVPNGFLTVDQQPIPLFLERNNDRMPTYHRLDFSWTISNPRLVKKRWVGEWTVTVYNLYGRKNAYNIYYQPRGNGNQNPLFGSSPLGSYRLTIFGAPIASLTYSFKFS